MAANTPMILSKDSQSGIVVYVKKAIEAMNQVYDMRTRMETIDRAYAREQDSSSENMKASTALARGDRTKYRNVEVPVIMPQVEAAVVYQSSVFLTGVPIFGVVSNPEYIDEALQMETLIEEQQIRGGWVRDFILFFRDGFKYNFSAVEVTWEDITTFAVETDLQFSSEEGKPKEVVWSGNVVRRLDPYNTIYDTRVPLADIPSRGEYAGYTRTMSRMELKQFLNTLPNKLVSNERDAFASQFSNTYFTPSVNPGVSTKTNSPNNFNWSAWAGVAGGTHKMDYQDFYEVTTLYGRILPSDFNMKVPSPNTPQVWKFIVVNNSVLIYCERQTNAHGLIPILFGQPFEDGLNYQTKSLAENAAGFQDITSAMWNSIIAARRRAISDRGLYDPSRVAAEHINNDSPTAKIPVKASVYGKPVAEAYYPIPFRDDQSSILMQETDAVLRMADKVSGQNPARQGQFVKGNKTRDEFQTVMGNANGRDQLISMLYEAQLFTPLKEIIKLNILQYQGKASFYNRDKEQTVQIDPIALRKAIIEFKISDGLTPTDKLINADALQVAMQMIGSSPQISSAYNIGPMFSYLMKTQGARISDFEKSPEQIAYEDAMRAWQETTLEMAKAGVQQFPPQPLPQQFGYQPAGQGVTSQQAPATQTTRINNIQNNIQSSEQQ